MSRKHIVNRVPIYVNKGCIYYVHTHTQERTHKQSNIHTHNIHTHPYTFTYKL